MDSPGVAVSGWPFLQSLLHSLPLYFLIRQTYKVSVLWWFKRSLFECGVDRKWGGGGESLMAALYCQPDWIWNHLGDAFLAVSLRMFPERFN